MNFFHLYHDIYTVALSWKQSCFPVFIFIKRFVL